MCGQTLLFIVIANGAIAELQALAVKSVVDYYDSIQQSLELEDQLIEAIHKMVLTLQQLTN